MARSTHSETSLCLEQFKTPNKVDTIPLLKDLYEYVTPQYAADWKVIGTLLGIQSGELRAIEAAYPTNVKWCCNQMLDKWLETDINASWRKLINVIKSPALSSGQMFVFTSYNLNKLEIIDKGANAISVLSNIVRERYKQERYINDEKQWPPNQPTYFIPLTLIYQDQTTVTTSSIQTGDVTSVISNQSIPERCLRLDSYDPLQKEFEGIYTKEFMEILAPLEKSKDSQFVLIEGAPGIGKSILLKEIAYRWGKKQLLQSFTLVLLICLHDPDVQCVSCIEDLLQLCYNKYTRSTQIPDACSEYLIQNCGKDLVFLFDGYDECPDALQKRV